MKNKVKTFFAVIFVAVILVTLVGCGKKEEEKGVDENPKINLGKWEENVYINGDLEIKFRLPEGWEPATKKEIAKIMNLSEDMLADEGKYMSEVAKQTTVCYAMATDPATGNNIIIMSEKATMPLEKYIETVKSQITSMQGMTYNVEQEGTEKLASKDYSAITLSESVYGYKQKQYITEKDGNFIVITMTNFTQEDIFNQLAINFQ